MIALLLLLQVAPTEGLTIERTVRVTTIDWLDRRREIHRKEVIRLRGDQLSIEDLTFGERLIIDPKRKVVVKADPLAGTYSEIPFKEIPVRRDRLLTGVRDAMKRVSGTPEEKKLRAMLESYGQFKTSPKVELRSKGNRREVVLNGDVVRVSVEVDPAGGDGSGFFRALSLAGAFHSSTAKKLSKIGACR